MKLAKTPLMLCLALFFLLITSASEQDFRSAILGECMNAKDCYCDYQCHASNDCCTAVSGTQPELTLEEIAKPLTCVSVENIFLDDSLSPTNKYIEVIAQCSNESAREEIKAGCADANLMLVAERETNLLQWLQTHALSVVPVVSFRDRRCYGNVYCAICNDQRRDQLHFSPIQLGCRIENNVTECLVSVKLPESLARPCIPKGPRLLSFERSFISMDDLFIIPDEYLNNHYITLPLNFDMKDNNTTLDHNAFPSMVDNKDDTGEIYVWIQIALIIFSILALTLMLAVYGLNANLRRSLAGMLTMGLGVALLSMELSFLVVAFAVPQAENRGFCVFMAAFFLFSLLSSFTWMTLLAMQLLTTFANCKSGLGLCWRFLTCRWDKRSPIATYSCGYRHSSPKKRFPKYLITAIILPLCLVLPAIAVNERAFKLIELVYANFSSSSQSSSDVQPDFIGLNITRVEAIGRPLATSDPGFCPDGSRAWFTNLGGLVVWFLVPAGTMITFNSVALLVVCVHICRLSKETQIHSSPQNEQERKRRENSKNLAGICAKLAIILGVSWFVQLFAGWWSQLIVLRRLLGLVNSAQGGVIAISMLVSVKARRAMANVLPEWCRGFLAPTSAAQRSTSRDKERSTSITSKTWTSVLLPRRNRPPTRTNGSSDS